MHKIIKAVTITGLLALSHQSHATEQPTNFATTIEAGDIHLAPEQEKLFAGQAEKDDAHYFSMGRAKYLYKDQPNLIKTSESNCYYSSHLAQIINIAYLEQARPEVFSCGGLTVQQLSSLDFNKIEFPKNYLSNLKDRIDEERSSLEDSPGYQKYLKTQREAMDYAHVYAITTTKNKE